MRTVKAIALGLLAGATIFPAISFAQGQPGATQQTTATPAVAATPAATDALLKKEQLDQLVAPIALYPDNCYPRS